MNPGRRVRYSASGAARSDARYSASSHERDSRIAQLMMPTML
jgi:hypothetical protein